MKVDQQSKYEWQGEVEQGHTRRHIEMLRASSLPLSHLLYILLAVLTLSSSRLRYLLILLRGISQFSDVRLFFYLFLYFYSYQSTNPQNINLNQFAELIHKIVLYGVTKKFHPFPLNFYYQSDIFVKLMAMYFRDRDLYFCSIMTISKFNPEGMEWV